MLCGKKYTAMVQDLCLFSTSHDFSCRDKALNKAETPLFVALRHSQEVRQVTRTLSIFTDTECYRGKEGREKEWVVVGI